MEKSYVKQLFALLPHGPAWSRSVKSTLSDLFSVLAGIFAWVDSRIKKLVDESDPLHAEETLSDWEADYGIPDGTGLSLDVRRSRIARKLAGSSSPNNDSLITAAATLGYDIKIFDFTPAMCGVSTCGSTLYVPEAVFYKSVCYEPGKYDAELESLILSMKQSHIEIVFNYDPNK